MPPHCDSLDGPVVIAARQAIDAGDVDLVLPYVKKDDESEVRAAFDLTLAARREGGAAREAADLHFFETAVRLHRAGEGAPFTGLKPAGLDVGPVIPLAERAIGSGSTDELADFLAAAVRDEVRRRYEDMRAAEPSPGAPVADVREYVEKMLGFEVWAHKLYGAVHAAAHGAHHG